MSFHSLAIALDGGGQCKSLANLSMLCGQIGRPSTGVNPLRGQNNVQGACDMGALPNVYAGYQAVTNPDIQHKFETAWDRKLPSKVGLTVMEMLLLPHLCDSDKKLFFVN